MSLPGRPKGEYRSAQHEGVPVNRARFIIESANRPGHPGPEIAAAEAASSPAAGVVRGVGRKATEGRLAQKELEHG